tara:strand:+ start:3788 stop:4186 length:399 start_codon:yes stop_codon:yes gene_type:complete
MDELLYVIVGFITGVSVGSVGIGAGSLLMPLLIMLGASVKTAVATGLAIQLLPQSLPGLWLYYQNGHFDMKISFWVIIGSLIGTTYGAYLVNYNIFSEKVLYIVLFIMMVLSTIFIGYDLFNNKFKYIVHEY